MPSLPKIKIALTVSITSWSVHSRPLCAHSAPDRTRMRLVFWTLAFGSIRLSHPSARPAHLLIIRTLPRICTLFALCSLCPFAAHKTHKDTRTHSPLLLVLRKGSAKPVGERYYTLCCIVANGVAARSRTRKNNRRYCFVAFRSFVFLPPVGLG